MSLHDPGGPSKDRQHSSDAQARRRHKSRRSKALEGTVAIIDRLLLQPRSMILNGAPTQLPTIHVIILQLLQKEMAGSNRARNALLKYERFANPRTDRGFEIRFAEIDYTREVAAEASKGAND